MIWDVWATVEPFEGWKLHDNQTIGPATNPSGPRLNPLRDGNHKIQLFCGNTTLVWATVEPFEGWKLLLFCSMI